METDEIIVGKIIKVDKKETGYNNYIIKSNNCKFIFSTKEKYKVGDILEVTGEKEENYVHYPFGFNYQDYLHYQNIKYALKNVEVNKIKNKISIHYLHYLINNYIDSNYSYDSSKYLKTLITGNDEHLDTTNISKIGISHLFVISGLHVNIIVIFIGKLLSLMKIKKSKQNMIIIFVISLYVIVTDFLISVIRVYLSLVLKMFNKRLTNLDLLSINTIIVLIINPYFMYSLSFILTYLIAFFMLVYQDVISIKIKILNKVLNMLILTTLIQLLTLPIVVSISPSFNIISILVNPLFIILVTYFLLPVSFIILLIPSLNSVYLYMVTIFEYLVDFFSNMTFLTIQLGNIHIIFKVLYFIIYYIFLYCLYSKKYKYLSLFIIVFIVWYYKGILNLKDRIYFLDLPEGEATLIISKYNRYVILVDSGEITKNNILNNIVINLGIRKIDYLIISHSDSDHIGGAFNLVKEISVKNIIFNYYDQNNTTNYFKKYVDKTYYLKKDDIIQTKYFKLKTYSPSIDYKDTNDNSLVIRLDVFNKSILFTGDISTKVEKTLSNYKINVDFLKVAHHGSKTSSNIDFINNIEYDHAIIMSGYYNKFGFPIEEVVNRYPKHKLLMTKDLGTIIVEVDKKNYRLIFSKNT
ncbi:MAG: DNA internalization-related competence protein ComEC/Rec2 [Bacilli bacterium]|nr:DNA internalization-related competence protein ComEC/Rec2 [Bacilli bacterium]